MTARRRTARISTVLAGLAILVLVASCRQLIDTSERPRCSLPDGARDPCHGCTLGSCCDAFLECRDDPACAALDDGLVARPFGDHACLATCRQVQAAGFTDRYAHLASCRAKSCAADCGLACGGYVYPSAGCADCAGACCAEAEACARDAGCLAASFCGRSCPPNDPACGTDCANRHGQLSRASASAFGDCIAASCSAECGVGPGPSAHWSCLGQTLETPDPGMERIFTIEFRVFDDPENPAGSPVDGATVRLCRLMDRTCDDPVWEELTFEGEAALKGPPDFDGYILASKQGLVTIRYYPGRPWEYLNIRLPLGTLEHDAYESLYASVGAVDFTKGMIDLDARDCADPPGNAWPVSFSLDPPDPSAIPFYGLQGIQKATDATIPGDANGGFLNVEPGWRTIQVTRRDTLECIARMGVYVAAGAEVDWYHIIPRRCD